MYNFLKVIFNVIINYNFIHNYFLFLLFSLSRQPFNTLISKGFLKLLTIKINGKTRRFDRASVIIK